jgi:hypothetical protein
VSASITSQCHCLISKVNSTPSGPQLFSFYQTLAAAFHNLSQLLDLELLVHDLNLLRVLSTSTFPRLYRLECYLPYTRSLASFLTRHPSLTYLHLAPSKYNRMRADTQLPDGPLAPTPKVVLPNLEYIVASNDCVTALAHDASLRAVYIEWRDANQPVQDCIAALQSSSSDSLRVLSCRRPGWNLDLIEVISSALPDLFVLSITNVLPIDVLPDYVRYHFQTPLPCPLTLCPQPVLEALGTHLAGFTSLRRLIIHSVDFWEFGRPPCLMDRDFACVRAWGAACPTLVECTLPRTSNISSPHLPILTYSHTPFPLP